MNKKESQVQIIRNNVQDSVRIKILDFIRTTGQNAMDLQQSLSYLKRNIELVFKGKWQVVVGKEFTAHMNDKEFPYFLEIITRGNTYLIFSRGTNIKKSQGNENKQY